MSDSQKSEKEGADLSLEAILVRRRPDLIRYARYVGKDLIAPEDLAQEVTLRALSASNAPRTEPEVVAWIFRIARNRVVDELRKATRWRGKVLPLDEGEGADAVQGLSPTARRRASRGETENILAEALGELDEASLDLVTLRFFGGLSTSEIAECRSIPIGTVCAKIFRATKRMRSTLENKGYTFSELDPMT